MPAPNLNDPVERAAYLGEMRRVGRGTRASGMALAVLGAVLAVVRAYWLPELPELVPLTLILLALGLMLIGIVRRVRWHLGRMRSG